MKPNFYENYYTKNPVYSNILELQSSYKISLKSLKNNIGKYMNILDRNINILEIGSWTWGFANYCNTLWFKNYIWFELDKNMVQRTKMIFPNYVFNTTDVFEFLHYKKNTFDLVFISHVFEHLEEDKAIEISQLIYDSLTQWWIWINTMPNSETPYVSQRYIDITHKKIYCSNSFSQILLEVGFKEEKIIHKEQFIWNNIITTIMLKIMKIFHKLFLLSAWIYPPKIFTQNFFTIAKK